MSAFTTGMASGSNKLRWTVRLVVTAALFMVSAVTMLAQSGGLVQGTVTDVKGGLIGGASVTITNNANGKKTTTTADAQGHFSMPGVTVGTYNLEASATGFQIATRKGVQVSEDKGRHPDADAAGSGCDGRDFGRRQRNPLHCCRAGSDGCAAR